MGLDIITESQYQERRAKQEGIQKLLRKIPGVSELIALSLTTSGFDSIGSVAEATIELLRTVPGLEEEDAARTIRTAAENFLAEHGLNVDKVEEPAVVKENDSPEKPALNGENTEKDSQSSDGVTQ